MAGLYFPALDTYIGLEVPAAKCVNRPLSANSTPWNPMLNDVYNKRIIELAGNIPRLGRLPAPGRQRHRSFEAVRVHRQDRPQDGRSGRHRLRARREGLRAWPGFLLDHGAPCGRLDRDRTARTARDRSQDAEGKRRAAEGKWADIALLEPVRDYKARHASTMLTFDAVVDAIGQIEAKSDTLAVRF